MDDKSQIRKANSLQTTSAGGNCTSQDSVSHVLSSSLDDQGNSQPISVTYSSQASPGIENSVATPNLQSLNSPSMLPSLTVLAETNEPHGAGASYNLHNVSGASQNSVVYASGQCPQLSILACSQRQMQGRQHVQHAVAQQHQQLTQKAPEYVYQKHSHNHILKQNSHGNMQPSTLQSHIHQPHHHQHDSSQQAQLQPSGPSFLRCSSGPQSSSSTHQQPQSSLMQSSPQFAFKQNQQSSGQQFKSSVLQQPLQSVIHQHQQSQQSLHQQQSSVPLQTMISIQQNQRLMGKQPDEAKIHQNEMLGQSNNVPSGWHRQEQPWLSYQKNNISKQQQHQHFLALPNEVQNLHQQYLGQQSNVSGTKQQQFFGSQSGASNMSLHQHSVHIMQRAKVPEEQQHTTPILFPAQGLESQSNSSKQQIISKFQMELAHLDLQKHPLSVHRDMHQGLHNSNALLESEIMTKRQRQMFQQPKMCSKASSASTNALAMTGQLKNADEAEEVYQRFKTMKRMHLPALKDILLIILNHQQQATKPEQSERLKQCKASVEYLLQLLQMDETNISLSKEKLDMVEKHIIYLIILFRPKGSLSHQQPQTFGDHHQQSQGQHHDNQMNTTMQPRNFKSAMTSMQPNGVASMHHSSRPSSVNYMGASALQTDITHTLQSGSRHHNTPSSVQLQQNNAASLQKITMNANQQAQMNVSTQNCMNAWQPNIHLLQQNNNVLHNQRMSQQEQQQLQTQQLKQQLQHCQMSLQFIQQQEQQQQQQNMQLHQQLKQQQWTQPLSHQMPQLRQTSEVKDMKGRPVMGVKLEEFSPHSASQHSAHENQSLKTGSPFSISSPQPSQAASPQVSQNSSPQIHQQIMSSSLSKAGTPLKSANSPAVTPSPSPSLTPSPAQGNLETQSTGVSPLPNAGNSGEQQTVLPPQVHSIIIGTPGISASPLLSESTGMDTHQVIAPINGSGKPSIIEQPHQRLFKVIKAMAPELFSSSVSDVGLVDSTVDTMHKSIQDKRYIMSVSKNMVTKRSLLRELTSDDAFSATKKIKCQSVAMPMNIVSSDGSTNDEVATMKGHGIQEPWSTAMSKAYNSMIQEIREINQKLLTTVVDIVNEDGKLTSNPSGDGKGIVVRCSFTALAVCPDLKSQHFPSQILPVLQVQLLVLTNYPHSSPVLLDTCPVNLSKEYELLFMKAKSLFTRSLRCLSQPMSVGVMAKSWDGCARAAMLEYAQANGGGSFCTRYGTWQNCVDTI